MSLTQIQRDAIAKARRGDYSLLDAIELDHRIGHDGALHGYLVGGRLRLIAYGDAIDGSCPHCDDGKAECTACDNGFVDCATCKEDPDNLVPHEACAGQGCEQCHEGKVNCPDCKGHGDTRCETCLGDEWVDCPECDGTGEGAAEEFENLRITNLDGRVLWREDDPADPPHPTNWKGKVGRDWTRSILAAYHKELSDAAEAATNPATRQTDILETSQCA